MHDYWGYGMMGGNYLFSWILGALGIIVLILIMVFAIKKIQNEDKKYKNRRSK